tara:strand:+ start:77467 stop:77715 length:249 start_codon:yes stop_codon:yes gene_type:complete
MTVLYKSKEPISFSELLLRTSLTKGNLSSHLAKLEGSRSVEIKKSFVEKKPLTTICISETGKIAFKQHLAKLQDILKQVSKK